MKYLTLNLYLTPSEEGKVRGIKNYGFNNFKVVVREVVVVVGVRVVREVVVVVVVREVNSSKCFQSRPMVREVRRRREMVKIVTSREVDVVVSV